MILHIWMAMLKMIRILNMTMKMIMTNSNENEYFDRPIKENFNENEDDKYEYFDRSISPDSDHLWRKASHMWTVCVIKMILKVMEVDRLCYKNDLKTDGKYITD